MDEPHEDFEEVIPAEPEGADAPDGEAGEEAAETAETAENAEGPEPVSGEHEMSGAEAYAAVEALLFATDRPVTPAQIARALPRGINARDVRRYLKAIQEELVSGERGFELREIAGGWQLLTRERFAPYVIRLRKAAISRKLTGSALETLAVVAYKQPVSRAEIERIRGVACGDMLRSLMEKRLIRIAGRSPDLGNPLLYGTTNEFLEHFALGSLSELPRSAEFGRKPKADEPAVTPPDAGDGPGGSEAAAEDGERGATGPSLDADAQRDDDAAGGDVEDTEQDAAGGSEAAGFGDGPDGTDNADDPDDPDAGPAREDGDLPA